MRTTPLRGRDLASSSGDFYEWRARIRESWRYIIVGVTFEMSNLRNLGNQMMVSLALDEGGYLGRECPVESCLGYFKITLGTGLKEPAPCHCPYCGHSGEQNNFFTREQNEYLSSVVMQKISGALHKDLKSLEFEHKPKGMFGIGFSLKVKNSPPPPIRYYREKQLETEVTCGRCTLRYAIYGAFGWCPDCGQHNSLQILGKNLDLAKKALALAASAEAEMTEYLIGGALENVVSAFDGFGREICLQKGEDIRFQNLTGARRRVQEAFEFDFAEGLSSAEWEAVCRVFQKRHVLAHKMGVIDEEYVRRSKDPGAIVGRKVRVSPEEVVAAVGAVEFMGNRLFVGALPPAP